MLVHHRARLPTGDLHREPPGSDWYTLFPNPDHARALAKGSEVLVLDHYREVFRIKPGAFPGATALARARPAAAFSPTHDELWTAGRRKLGDAGGTEP